MPASSRVPLKNQSLRDLTEIRESFAVRSSLPIWKVIYSSSNQSELPMAICALSSAYASFKLGVSPGSIWDAAFKARVHSHRAKHQCRLTLLDLTAEIAYSCRAMPGYRTSDYRTSL